MNNPSPLLNPNKMPPGPSGSLLFGHIPAIVRDVLGFSREMLATYGDVVHFRIGPIRSYVFNHPRHFKHVLIDRAANYRKSYAYRKMKPLLGEGLITSHGDVWTRKRAVVMQSFVGPKVASYFSIFHELTLQKIGELKSGGKAGTQGGIHSDADRIRGNDSIGRRVDLYEQMVDLTLRIICRSILGSQVADETPLVSRSLGIFMKEAERRIMSVTSIGEYLPLPRNFRFRRALADLDKIVFEMIAEHRHGPRDEIPDEIPTDMLTAMLTMKNERGEPMFSDQEVRDEVMTLFIAGHETSAAGLLWTLVALAAHPGVLQKARTEIESVLPGGEILTAPKLAQLGYIEQIISEALRLWPPVWILSREAIEDDVIDGYKIPKNSLVVLLNYFLHRRPDLWPEPEKFDPERFAPGADKGRVPLSYMPFGAGPRQCIAGAFARVEMKVILVEFLRHFEWEFEPGQNMTPVPTLTLRPHGPIFAQLRERT